MTTKLVWRLATRPTPQEVMDLKDRGLITKEEAREILFTSEEVEERDQRKALESEIAFLRKLAEKMGNQSKIVETIRIIEKPYYNQPWYPAYATWCGGGTITTTAGGNGTWVTTGTTPTATSGYAYVGGSTSNTVNFTGVGAQGSTNTSGGFSTIKTF